MVQHLCLALDVYFPRQMDYTDFCSRSTSMTEYGFANRVARLNVNTLYLCLKHGMQPEDLRARQTLHNLKGLLDRFAESEIAPSQVVFTPTTLDFFYKSSAELKKELEDIRKTVEDIEEEEAEQERVYGRNLGAALLSAEDADWEDVGEMDTELFVAASAAVAAQFPPRTPSPSSATMMNSLATAGSSIVSSFMRGFGGNTN